MSVKMLVYMLDDSPAALRNARHWLDDEGIDMVACLNADQLRRALVKDKPGIILLDWQMPGTSGALVYKELKGSIDEAITPVAFYSSFSDAPKICTAYEMGAAAYILKGQSDEDDIVLIEKLKEIWQKVIKRWEMNAPWRKVLEQLEASPDIGRLEYQIFDLMCRGIHSNEEIARLVDKKPSTVANYKSVILKTAGDISAVELFKLYAMRYSERLSTGNF